MCVSLRHRVVTDDWESICYTFLSRGARTLRGVSLLYEHNLSECAQALVRSLFENRVSFDWFIKLAEANREDAVRRYKDANHLQWVKQSNDWESHELPNPSDPTEAKKMRQGEAEIKARYSEGEFSKMRIYGFSGLSIEQRADELKYGPLYCVAYRTFSRNVHASDYAEQLALLRGTDMGSLPELVENISFCTAQFSVHGIAEKVDSVFSLGATDTLRQFKMQHEKLARAETHLIV